MSKKKRPFHKKKDKSQFKQSKEVSLKIDQFNKNILDKPATIYCYDNYITGVNYAIKDKNIHFINHDVTLPFEIDDNIDYIIHAAGIASPLYYTKHPIETMDVSTIGTRNMLELA